MRPIFTTIDDTLDLMVIPDSEASADGHVVLTYTYSIYKDHFNGSGKYIEKKERKLHLEWKNDPDYCGFITFEQPGKLFTYTSDGAFDLSAQAIQELLEVINHYRNTPSLWLLD